MAEEFSALAATLLAISLATERLVVAAKTTFPTLFEEKKTEAKEVWLSKDRNRRLSVQAIAFGAALVSALAVAGDPNPFASMPVGNMSLPVPLVALLCSGGSAFWAQIIGYTSALKDITVANKASASLDFTRKAQSMGLSPQDSGTVASRKTLQEGHDTMLSTLRSTEPMTMNQPVGG